MRLILPTSYFLDLLIKQSGGGASNYLPSVDFEALE